MRTKGPLEKHNRHKVSFSSQARDVIRISDIILTTVDARYIQESRIPELEELILAEGKRLIHVIMKVDLLSEPLPQELLATLSHPVQVSTKSRQGLKRLRERIHILAKKYTEREYVHIGVIGYPNTGKSSLISILARRAAAPTSAQSGFTKGIRKVRFTKGILLIDTPGVIRTTESLFTGDQKKNALLGIHIPETVKNPELIVAELLKTHRKEMYKTYKIDTDDTEVLINELGKRWHMLKRKGEVASDRVSRRILKDWHEGKIGKA